MHEGGCGRDVALGGGPRLPRPALVAPAPPLAAHADPAMPARLTSKRGRQDAATGGGPPSPPPRSRARPGRAGGARGPRDARPPYCRVRKAGGAPCPWGDAPAGGRGSRSREGPPQAHLRTLSWTRSWASLGPGSPRPKAALGFLRP